MLNVTEIDAILREQPELLAMMCERCTHTNQMIHILQQPVDIQGCRGVEHICRPCLRYLRAQLIANPPAVRVPRGWESIVVD